MHYNFEVIHEIDAIFSILSYEDRYLAQFILSDFVRIYLFVCLLVIFLSLVFARG